MNTNEAMRAAVDNAGLSLRSASLALGKSENWLSSTLQRNGSSSGDTLARLGEVCGYSLALIPKGMEPSDALVIDPPESEG